MASVFPCQLQKKMAACHVQAALLQEAFLPALLQNFLSEICSTTVLTLVQRSLLQKGSSMSLTVKCLHPVETRPSDINTSMIGPYAAESAASIIEEEMDSSEKCTAKNVGDVPAPDTVVKISRQEFSEWMLFAKNKDDEDDDEDEEDEEDDEEDDEGNEEEGDDEDGVEGEDEEDEGDDDDQEDEGDEDEEDEEDQDEEDDDDEDETPAKKPRK